MSGEVNSGIDEWRRHWPILVPSLAGIMLSAVNGYSLGVVMGPLEQEFGWSRTQISIGPLIISFMGLLAAPVVGVGIDRLGTRRIAIIGVLIFCSALAFVSTAGDDITSWWARWAILGLGSMFILPTVWTKAINSLFSVNRGKALAVALCGTGLSAAMIPVVTNALVEWNGWRGAYIGLAIIGAIVVLPAVLFLFHSPTDTRVGEAKTAASIEALRGMGAREGFTSPAFLKLAGAVLLFGITSCALTVNAVPVLRTQGFDASTAAWMAGLIGIGSIAGRLGGGFLLDRYDAKKVAAAGSFMPVLTVLFFTMFPGSLWPVAAGSLLLGLSAGTEVDACSYLAARHFGMRSFGTLFGAINGIVLFGAGIAPIAANHVYDLTGTYHWVLLSVVPISLIAASLFLLLGTYPQWTTEQLGGKQSPLLPPSRPASTLAG